MSCRLRRQHVGPPAALGAGRQARSAQQEHCPAHRVAHRAARERRGGGRRVWRLPQHRGGVQPRPRPGAGHLWRGARLGPCHCCCCLGDAAAWALGACGSSEYGAASLLPPACSRQPPRLLLPRHLLGCPPASRPSPSPPCRSTWPPTCRPRSWWQPRRSRWTMRRRASPSPPSERWVHRCSSGGPCGAGRWQRAWVAWQRQRQQHHLVYNPSSGATFPACPPRYQPAPNSSRAHPLTHPYPLPSSSPCL